MYLYCLQIQPEEVSVAPAPHHSLQQVAQDQNPLQTENH